MKYLTALRKQTASFRLIDLLAIAPLWLMLAAVNTSAYAQTTPSPGDWTQFHRDNMQRWNPYETVLGVNNVGSLQSKWKSSIGSSSFFSGLQSSLAVVNGVVYFSSYNGNVYALNASTGATLWSSFGTGNGNSSPAVVNGVVYVGSSDHNVYALNAGTGATLWSFATGGEAQPSPAVVNGVVYISSLDNNVYALSASTGAKLWSYAIGGEVDSSPAVANGVVYFGSHTFPDNTGKLYALNANTGAKLWSYATETPVSSSPAVANGVVYFGSDASDLDHNMYALNASTGAKLWSYATGASVFSSPAVANGVVYFGSRDHNVYALNASTGAKLWSYDTGRSVSSSPAVANGVVYISDDNSIMYALNASSGTKLWSYGTGGEPAGFDYLAMPSPVNGVVYVHGSGSVYAFSLGADLFLRINPSATTVHQGDLITYAFPVWNLGPANAVHEVLMTEVPAGTTLDYIRISGTPGLGTCTAPPYQGTGPIVCHENSAMAPNTTWTVRVVVKVTAPSGTVITANAAVTEDTVDPNMANNMATVSTTVQ